MRTMTTLSFAGSGDRDARDRNLLFPSLLGACYFRQICPFHRRFCDFALTHPPLQGFTGLDSNFAGIESQLPPFLLPGHKPCRVCKIAGQDGPACATARAIPGRCRGQVLRTLSAVPRAVAHPTAIL
jgi:hypothetical protein